MKHTINRGDVFYANLKSDGTYAVSVGSATDKNIIIPPSYNGISVTQVKENGFKGITDLESVALPEGIAVIGKYAFSACTNLSITIPKSVHTIQAEGLLGVKEITVTGTNNWYAADFKYEYTSTNWVYSSSGKTSYNGARSNSTYKTILETRSDSAYRYYRTSVAWTRE
jgi:hypothetical protein